MPEAEQVLDGGRDARCLVGVDGGVAAVGIAVRDDDRHAGGDVEAGPVEDLGLDDGEAVDGLVGEPSDGALDGLLGLVLDADHVDRVAAWPGRPEIAARVRALPCAVTSKVTTPRAWKRPRVRARAALLRW